MCVIYFAYEQTADHPLLLLANRDEFYERPTAAAAQWIDHPHVFGGRDLVGGGTWMAVSNNGRIAAVTNYRDPSAPLGQLSRGKLVSDFVVGEESAAEYLDKIEMAEDEYSGFNLIVGEFGGGRSEMFYFSNRGSGIQKLTSGIYGLSNHLLDTPWPKVQKGKSAMTDLIKNPDAREQMFGLLADGTLAADADLPDTGIGYEKEKALSSIFIATPNYGTRCSTVVVADREGKFEFEERVFV